LDLIRRFDEREVGFTITSLSDDVRKSFEPLSSPPEEKLSAIKELKDEGVKTYVFFGPILPYISDQNLEQYFQQVAFAGVDYVLVDKLNLKPGLWPILDGFMRENLSQFHEEWKKIFLGKNDYYQDLRARIDGICKRLELECRFCF
jgi:DNA repair photolyase